MIRVALIDDDGEAAARVAAVAPRLTRCSFTALAAQGPLAGESARQIGAHVRAASLRDLVSRHADAFDAVAILGQVDDPASLARAAAEAGKHVMVAAPLVTSVVQLDEMFAACEAAEVCLFVSHPWRFDPAVRAAKEAIEAGKLGELGLVRIHDWQAVREDHSRAAEALCGRSTFSRIAAQIDLASFLFDSPAEVVHTVATWAVEASCHGSLLVHLGFAGGGMALVDFAALPCGDDYYSVTAIGSRGAAYADDHYNAHLLFGGGRVAALPSSRGESLLPQLEALADTITQRRPATVTAAAARAALDAAVAAGESLRARREVRLSRDRHVVP